MGRRVSSGWLVLALALTAPRARADEGLSSCRRAREALEAGLTATGGVEALRAARAVRRRMSADWFGSGQGLRPEPFSGPTLTPPDTNGHDSLVSFADYGGHRWLDELVESDLTGDSLLRTTALAEDGGFETVTWRDERPSTWRRTFPSSRRPTRRR